MEKRIANEIVSNECNVENDVTKKLTNIMETNISAIQKQKRIVTKLMQDNESAKHKYQVSVFCLSFSFINFGIFRFFDKIGWFLYGFLLICHLELYCRTLSIVV